jgi:PAS domain S-box-containing protein
MTASDTPNFGAPELANLLAGTAFAAAQRAGAPLLIAELAPPRLFYANDSALALFHVSDLKALDQAVLAGASPGAKRLRDLSRSLPVNGQPRLELLRFFAKRTPLTISLSCARLRDASGAEFLVASSFTSSRAATMPNTAPVTKILSAAVEAPAVLSERFLWSVDGALNFGPPDRALAEALGEQTPRPGESLASLKARTGLDNDGRFEAALAGKTTFGGLNLVWPVASGAGALAMLLSGAPLFDREQRFLGFRGFGRVVEKRTSIPVEPAAASAEGTDVVEMSAHDQAVAIASAPKEPVLDKQPASSPIGLTSQGAEIVQLRPLALVGAQNVIPIRPDLRSFTPPEEPQRGDGETSVELTQSERNAFREIAKALGAKVRDDDYEPPEADQDELAGPHPSASNELGIDSDAWRLLDRLPIGALIARGDEALYLNRTLLDLLDYADLEEFRSRSGVSGLFSDDSADNFGPTAKPISLVGADGQFIAVEGLVQTIDWRGAAATLFSFRRSVVAEPSPRRASTNEAYESEKETGELVAILDAAADAVVVLDRDGKILSLNRSGETLLGVEHREVAGQDFTILFAPESREAVKGLFEGLRASGLDRLAEKGRETVGLTRNGRAAPLFVTIARIGGGEDAKFCAVMRDMTRWKEVERDLEDARRQAERSSALKSEFLAKISHEIRTPLNAIIGFAEVIMEERYGPIGNEKYKEYLKDIHASGGHVMSLVNDLLDLSKIEAGKADLKLAPLDANLVIQECLALMQPQAANERVIMRLSLSERLPRVVADERSLRQIMLNLMSNAVKFNEPGGQVIVSTAMNDSGQAIIRVRDTGVGMSEGEIATALEPFRQVDATRRAGGTGLGLPLTKALAEANRAQFSIKSRKEQGTLVELAFPTTPAAAAQ